MATVSVALRAKEIGSRGFAKNALELCAPLKFCGPMLRLALRNFFVFLTECFVGKQNICFFFFLGEGKRTCFQLKIGLSTEAAKFFLLGVFLPHRMLQTIC